MSLLTDLTTLELVLICWALLLTGAAVLFLVALTNWMRRYERFRRECGAVLGEQRIRIEDHETRLRALGSGSPRRLQEVSDEEMWARRSS